MTLATMKLDTLSAVRSNRSEAPHSKTHAAVELQAIMLFFCVANACVAVALRGARERERSPEADAFA